MIDQYGNYVIQAVFIIAKTEFDKDLYYEKLY